MHGTAQKSFDLIVHKPNGSALLIDIKGRKLKYASFQKSNPGQNWVTNSDIDSMQYWQDHFGPDHLPLFVFAYWIFDNNPQPTAPIKSPDTPTSTIAPQPSVAPPSPSVSVRSLPQDSNSPHELRSASQPLRSPSLPLHATTADRHTPSADHLPDFFQHNSRLYWFIAINVADYQAVMKTRSPKWHTVHLSAQNFRHLSKPVSQFLP